MRLALILAREHGSESFAVISGPDIPYPQQVDRFKGLTVTAVSHNFAEIQLWTSDEGQTRRKKFAALEASVSSRIDLAAELSRLNEVKLRTLAANHNIDLTGLTEKVDLVTAIVIAVRLQHLKLQPPLPPQPSESTEEESGSEDVEAHDDDPGVFDGPSIATLALQPATTG